MGTGHTIAENGAKLVDTVGLVDGDQSCCRPGRLRVQVLWQLLSTCAYYICLQGVHLAGDVVDTVKDTGSRLVDQSLKLAGTGGYHMCQAESQLPLACNLVHMYMTAGKETVDHSVRWMQWGVTKILTKVQQACLLVLVLQHSHEENILCCFWCLLLGHHCRAARGVAPQPRTYLCCIVKTHRGPSMNHLTGAMWRVGWCIRLY
jgi:hypothetical protein